MTILSFAKKLFENGCKTDIQVGLFFIKIHSERKPNVFFLNLSVGTFYGKIFILYKQNQKLA